MTGCYAPFLGHSWYTVDRFNSERWTICSGDILIRFVCLLANIMQHLSEKMQFPGFLFPKVVQKEALVK